MSCQTRRPSSSQSLVEVVELVEAAAPDADHVHVGGDRFAEQPARCGSRVMRDGQRVGGNPVGALGEDVDAVDAEGHRHAGGVRLVDQLELAQPDLRRRPRSPGIDDRRVVERLLAIARRPPERGLVERRSTATPCRRFRRSRRHWR